MRKTMLAAMIALLATPPMADAAEVNLDHFLRRDAFTDIKLSPGGEYYAATIPFEKETALAILRVADGKLVGQFMPPQHNHAYRFDWVSDDRVLIELAQKLGSLDMPQRTGELYSLRANTPAARCWSVTGLMRRRPGRIFQARRPSAWPPSSPTTCRLTTATF